MSYAQIVPAIIPQSREELVDLSDRLLFAREVQVDLVDGKFVPFVSWPYEPTGEAVSVKSQLDRYTLEIDLMVEDPIAAAEEWVVAGADMLIFHIETVELDVLKDFADNTPVSVGVSAHGDTPLEKLIEYIPAADYIQLMGIYEIGTQGQPFDEAVLGKIEELKRLFPAISITIDGSVNKDTIKRLHDAGADRFACGSAIIKQPDPEVAYEELAALING